MVILSQQKVFMKKKWWPRNKHCVWTEIVLFDPPPLDRYPTTWIMVQLQKLTTSSSFCLFVLKNITGTWSPLKENKKNFVDKKESQKPLKLWNIEVLKEQVCTQTTESRWELPYYYLFGFLWPIFSLPSLKAATNLWFLIRWSYLPKLFIVYLPLTCVTLLPRYCIVWTILYFYQLWWRL